ncbi:23749_t:CDS:2 [Cetraspora pellucida]|uniref:23749_t:CDS:1 n=1 Tax=Cetraspora pellucida TaxID=1433469 RepID=A0A9N9N522_9GLOM|nr:23749_t:CDS:2 [Cetraspora pellucida]
MAKNSMSKDIKNELEKVDFDVGIANNKLDKLAEDISDIKNKISDAKTQNITLNDPPTGYCKRDSVIKKYYKGAAVAWGTFVFDDFRDQQYSSERLVKEFNLNHVESHNKK